MCKKILGRIKAIERSHSNTTNVVVENINKVRFIKKDDKDDKDDKDGEYKLSDYFVVGGELELEENKTKVLTLEIENREDNRMFDLIKNAFDKQYLVELEFIKQGQKQGQGQEQGQGQKQGQGQEQGQKQGQEQGQKQEQGQEQGQGQITKITVINQEE